MKDYFQKENTGVLLAAGLSRRMGSENKLLLPFNGEPLLAAAVRAIALSSLRRVIIVYSDRTVKQAVESIAPVQWEWVFNHAPHKGRRRSVALGVRAAGNARGILFLLGDQPFVSAGLIDLVLETGAKLPDYFVRPVNSRGPGNPVLFPRSSFGELLNLKGNKTPGSLLDQKSKKVHDLTLEDDWFNFDIDTRKDYQQAREGLKKRLFRSPGAL